VEMQECHESNPLLIELRKRTARWVDLSVVGVLPNRAPYHSVLTYVTDTQCKYIKSTGHEGGEVMLNKDFDAAQSSYKTAHVLSEHLTNNHVHALFKTGDLTGTHVNINVGLSLRIYDFVYLSPKEYESIEHDGKKLGTLICTQLCETWA